MMGHAGYVIQLVQRPAHQIKRITPDDRNLRRPPVDIPDDAEMLNLPHNKTNVSFNVHSSHSHVTTFDAAKLCN